MIFWKSKLTIGMAILSAIFSSAAALQIIVTLIASETIYRNSTAWLKDAKYEGTEGVVLQTRMTNCGPAALKMVLESLGIDRELTDIEDMIGLDETGSSLFDLMKYAESQGVHAEAWRLNIDDLKDKPLPAIVFIEDDHFAVLDQINQHGEIILRDPAIGRLRISKEAFEHIWGGETLIIKHSPCGGRGCHLLSG